MRSTNDLVVWLRPSPVVAKISVDGDAANALAMAHRLAGAGAPIVAPADDIGHWVYRVGGRQVTFWRDESQDAVGEPGPEPVARALFALHEVLAAVVGHSERPSYDEQIIDAVRASDRPGFAPGLGPGDRQALRRRLNDGRRGGAPTVSTAVPTCATMPNTTWPIVRGAR